MKISSFDLLDDNLPVVFLFKTMEEIWEEYGDTPDNPHKHNFFTVIWVKSGAGCHVVDFKSHEIKASRVFFLSPGQVHQVITPIAPTGLVLMFTKEFVRKYGIGEDLMHNLNLFGTESPYVDVPEKKDGFLRVAADEIIKSFGDLSCNVERFRNETVAAWLKLFLIECSRYAVKDSIDNTQLLESRNIIVEEFRRLLELNYSKWHRVKDYSEQIGVTPDYLNNVIRSFLGKSAKELIIERVILESKRLAVNTLLTLKEISFSVGFNDPYHFSKFFKSATGESFSNFRKSVFSI